MESLCSTCSHVRTVVSGTGSKFLLCRLSQERNQFARYPPQPVVRCDGYKVKPEEMASFTLHVLSGELAICRLVPDADLPNWATGEILSMTRTSQELSIVCSQDRVPDHVQCESGWRCFQVAGPLDFEMVGVIAGLTGTLAAQNISVFVVSTFDTDYLMVRQTDLEAAIASLSAAGHQISS